VNPMVLEYIDRSTMRSLVNHHQLALGIPADVSVRTGAYLVIVLEGRTAAPVEADLRVVSELVAEAGALDVFVLAGRQGRELLDARENAFWMVKAAGADELIDMVVPRTSIPEYLGNVRQISKERGSRVYGCGHAGDGNIHFSVYEPDADRRHTLLLAIYRAGLELGGAISGEHGIGLSKKGYYRELGDPVKIALERQLKAAFDPAGILNPGKIFDAPS
jgi:glycolate oxidase